MDFNQLLAKMNELSKPAPASTAVVEQPVVAQECGEMPPAPMGMDKPADTPPPSMSVNLNAQGLDNIEELLSLIKAVNPDADKPAMPMGAAPTIEIEPMDKPAGGMPKLGGLGDLGNLDSGPLKMLPDLDADNDDKVGGEIDGADIDGVSKAQGDLDNDGDHDMDDHDMEKDKDEGYDKRDAYERDFDASQTGFGPREREDDEGEDESFANSVAGSEPEFKGADAVIPNGNDLNKEKKMFKRSQPGDNPMAMEGEELRAWIKSELTQRLAEVKGAK